MTHLAHHRRDADTLCHRRLATTFSKPTRRPNCTALRVLAAGQKEVTETVTAANEATVSVGKAVAREIRGKTKPVGRRVIQYYYCSVLQRLVKQKIISPRWLLESCFEASLSLHFPYFARLGTSLPHSLLPSGATGPHLSSEPLPYLGLSVSVGVL